VAHDLHARDTTDALAKNHPKVGHAVSALTSQFDFATPRFNHVTLRADPNARTVEVTYDDRDGQALFTNRYEPT
jgi:hypothetical protein